MSEMTEMLDMIFEILDKMLLRSEFKQCDAILKLLDTTQTHIAVLLGVLTVTYPAKKLLPNRPRFYARVEQRIQDDGRASEAESLLSGLE